MTNEEIIEALGTPPADLLERLARLASVLVTCELSPYQSRLLVESYICIESAEATGVPLSTTISRLGEFLRSVDLSWEPHVCGIKWGWQASEGMTDDEALALTFDADLVAQVRLELAEGL